MNLEIVLNNGSKFYPSFDPEHWDTVLEFYSKEFLSGKIFSYKIL